MFLTNKYTNLYFRIIDSARKNPPESGERHHIIPGSLGGSDDPKNKILLSTRQHFLCHKLLIKMLEGLERHKMINAFCYMALTRNNTCLRRKISSRDYELARKLCKIRIYTKERNEKISDAKKGVPIIRSDEAKRKHKETLANKKKSGIGLSDFHKEAIRKSLMGNKNGANMVITQEHRKIMADTHSKDYVITDPQGNAFQIRNLSEWLRTMNCKTTLKNRVYRRGPLKGYLITVAP